MRAPTQNAGWPRAGWRLLAAAAFGFTLDAGAQAPTINLTSAWMRPALAGQAGARAYVDIRSDTALTLTEATTPAARAIEFVLVGGNDADETVVTTVPVAAGTPVRLAFRGNHLRLVDVNRNLGNGEQVPVTLHFVDSEGRVVRATADVVVRGFTVPAAVSDPRRP